MPAEGPQHPMHCLCEKLALVGADALVPQSASDKYFEALQGMIKRDPEFDAAEAEDRQQRSLLKIAEGHGASSSLSQGIRRMVLFHRCYNIKRAPPAHESATCIVAFAEHYDIADSKHAHFSLLGSAAARPVVTLVAMKFMKEADQFGRELSVRKQFKIKPDFVIRPHVAKGKALSYNSLDDSAFKEELKRYNFRKVLQLSSKQTFEYSCCIVFPQAVMGLHELITHGRIAGQADRISDVRAVMQQIGKAVEHLHGRNIIHGDLKPLNIMKVVEVQVNENGKSGNVDRWKLIDLDAAAEIGHPAGKKWSTGYAPPELLTSADGEVMVKHAAVESSALLAHPSFDIWSIGVILYLLITGEPLFKNNQEDNLGGDELDRLFGWNLKGLLKSLKNVDGRNTVRRPLANDLLSKLLQPSAPERPNDLEEVLDHPFFVGDHSEEIEQLQQELKQELSRTAHNESDAHALRARLVQLEADRR